MTKEKYKATNEQNEKKPSKETCHMKTERLATELRSTFTQR